MEQHVGGGSRGAGGESICPAVEACIEAFLAVRTDEVLDNSHGLAVGEQLARPTIDNLPVAFQGAFDDVLTQASKRQSGIRVGNGLVDTVQRTAVGEFHGLAVRIVAVEMELEAFGDLFDLVDGAAARASKLIIESGGIELPPANERIDLGFALVNGIFCVCKRSIGSREFREESAEFGGIFFAGLGFYAAGYVYGVGADNADGFGYVFGS